MIHVVERLPNGERKFMNYPARYVFYYDDPAGKFTSISGTPVTRVQTTNKRAFQKEKKAQYGKRLFESDSNITFRCLADHYTDAVTPTLNVCYFDIEVDFNKVVGFAPASDPFNRVTAVGLHLGWINQTIALVLKPEKMSQEEAHEIVESIDGAILMDSEEELLQTFLELIEDADIFTGWNSESFDIPYMVNRIARVLGKDYNRKFCLWDQQPKQRTFENAFGSTIQTYDLVGRIHMDYMLLYRKYTYHEMHSYSLDAIADHELGERKIEYEGTLDQLYNNDFKKFIEYNIQDTVLLRRLDDKLQFIDQANLMAHANTVLLATVMGSVAQIDQAIINEAHRRGMVVPDKTRGDSLPAAGAYVANPIKGLHKWIASMDLNSLYPSILRSCNMSPECIVAQIRHTITTPEIEEYMGRIKEGAVARYWEGKFACKEYELVMSQDRDVKLYIDFEDGTSYEASGAEIYDLVFDKGNPWAITANGTIFSFEQQGIIPSLLERWYAERKEMQATAKKYRANMNGVQVEKNLADSIRKYL